jgi:hypothetical protein
MVFLTGTASYMYGHIQHTYKVLANRSDAADIILATSRCT